LAYFLLGLLLFAAALRGVWISDDISIVRDNEPLHTLTLANLASFFDPHSSASISAHNFTPISVLLHSLAWQCFGSDVLGHHVVNVAFHALVTVLLLRVFLALRLSGPVAFAGATFFFVHPANVEPAAWISQLKTLASTAGCLAALLLWERRPGWATFCFALALLTKVTAVFVIPVAMALDWWRTGHVRWRWIALCVAVTIAYMIPEMGVFRLIGEAGPLDESSAVWLRTIVAIAARYLVMAVTAHGVSAFHDPPRAHSPWDPWWLAGLLLLTLFAVRMIYTVWRREPEGVFWVWAAAAFVPVSQILPFANEMGDRYLYTILPGLIGATLAAGVSAAEWIESACARRGASPLPQSLGQGRVLAVLVVAVAIAFGVQSQVRAGIWRSESAMVADSILNYPNSVLARWSRARMVAITGDAGETAAALRRAMELGFDRHDKVIGDPAFDAVRSDPRIQALIHEMARTWIARLQPLPELDQARALSLAGAYYALGDLDAGIRTLEHALELDGSLSETVRRDLDALRKQAASRTRRTERPDG